MAEILMNSRNQEAWGKKYKTVYEISSHDVDVNNNGRPSIIQRYLLETANHQMRDRKPTYYELFFEGKAFILSRISIEIFENIHQYDDVEVSTWRCPSKGVTFVRCWEARRGDTLLVRAYSAWAIADRNEGGFCKIDQVDLSNYEIDEILDMNISTRFRLDKNLTFEKVCDKTVQFSDIDMNMHMNNTYYADMLWNCIPDLLHKDVTSVNIRYMKEAPLGADIEVYMAKMNQAPKGDERADETYCFTTKIDGKTNIEAQIGMRHFERES